MTISLLALDLALHTGYSQWSPGMPKPNAGLLKVKNEKFADDEASKGRVLGVRLASLYKWGLKVTKEWQVTEISVETPLVGGSVAGHAAEFHWLISAYGVIAMMGAQLNIPVVPIANATMAVHWLGTRDIEKKLRKTYSILEAQRRGFPNVQDHNIADSLGLLSLRCAVLGLQTPWDSKRSPGPLFTGLTGKPAGTAITKSNKIAAAKILNAAGSFDREGK